MSNLLYSLTIDGMSLLESLLLYGGVGLMLYLCYLQFRSVKRRRRHRRHRARRRAQDTAERVHHAP
jgi:hypothetical protein